MTPKQRERIMQANTLGLEPGDVYGELTVVKFVGCDSRGRRLWLCRCKCGAEVTAATERLTAGKVLRCEACQKSRRRTGRLKHGRCGTPEWICWSHMKSRCQNPRDRGYPSYGGRGITVCERWQDFNTFLIDMGPRPSVHHTLERLDNNGNYEPGNCAWATKKQQCRNRRSNVLLAYRGRTLSAAEWAEKMGLPTYIVAGRIRLGWTIKRALETPVHGSSLDKLGDVGIEALLAAVLEEIKAAQEPGEPLARLQRALRDRAIFELMGAHDLSGGDVASISLDDLSLISGKLKIQRVKRGAGSPSLDVCVLTERETEALTDWLRERGGAPGALFVSRNRQPMSRTRIHELLIRYRYQSQFLRPNPA